VSRSTRMSGNYLLDTSIIIDLFSGDQQILAHIGEARAVLIPSIAIGELYYGALKSVRREENLNQITQLIAENIIVGSDAITGRWFGVIKNDLRKTGRMIPENDIWIAAIALQYQLVVATRDKHFEAVVNLDVEMWRR